MIVKELIGPWIFGVGLFTSLLFTATYLGRLAGFLVGGIPVTLVMELTALYLPAMVVKTFSMAMLLAALLGFGRLSSDSEIVALRAGGASLSRIILPVAVYSMIVAVITFAFNEGVVPPASRKAVEIENQVARIQTPGAGPNFYYPDVRHQKLAFSVTAAHVNRAIGELQDVSVVQYDPNEQPLRIMTAPVVKWAGPNDPGDWYIPRGARIESLQEPLTVEQVNGGIWPGDKIPPLKMPYVALIQIKDNNYDAISLLDLRERINLSRQKGDKNPHDMADSEYGYWNKIAVPLAALVFGCLGAVLGIRSHRTGTASGMALAVAIIFGYFMLASFMNVWALGGAIPPWAASFSPLAIGIVATVVIMKRRNI